MVGDRLPFFFHLLGGRTSSRTSARYGGTWPRPDWRDENRAVIQRSTKAFIPGSEMSAFKYSLRYAEANRMTPVAEHGHKKSFRGVDQVRGYTLAISKLTTLAMFGEHHCAGLFNKSRVADHNRQTLEKSATTLQNCFYLFLSATCWAASAASRATVSS